MRTDLDTSRPAAARVCGSSMPGRSLAAVHFIEGSEMQSDEWNQVFEALEKADRLFRGLDGVSERAESYWNEGMDRLATAIWVYEKEHEQD